MNRSPISLFVVCAFLSGMLPVFAEGADESLVVPSEISASLRQTAMPDLGGGRLASILNRYYKEGLGGPGNWERIESLRTTGTIALEAGSFPFRAYQKKPDLIKLIVKGEPRSLVLGYDGKTAWRKLPGVASEAVTMEAAEARRFIHGARFGSYLLYPYAEGKRITYVDTVPIEGVICHQIRVDLETGYQVDYFIDIRSYLEIKVVNRDVEAGSVHSVTYSDYIRKSGLPIARKVVSHEEGELRSTLELDEVKVNRGIMPWMFKKPE